MQTGFGAGCRSFIIRGLDPLEGRYECKNDKDGGIDNSFVVFVYICGICGIFAYFWKLVLNNINIYSKNIQKHLTYIEQKRYNSIMHYTRRLM